MSRRRLRGVAPGRRGRRERRERRERGERRVGMTSEIAIFDLDSALLRSSPLPVLAEAMTEVDRIGGTIAGALQTLYRAVAAVSGPILTPVALRAVLTQTKGGQSDRRRP